MRVEYEWDAEEVRPDGDIVDHNHEQTFSEVARVQPEFGTANHIEVVLVRDTPLDREWAYIKDGRLPEFFEDAFGKPTAKVPARFHKEVARARS